MKLRFLYLIPPGMIKVLQGKITFNQFFALLEMDRVENHLRL